MDCAILNELVLCVCTALIGNNAIVCEGAYVEKKSMLAAGGVLMPGQRIPAGQVQGQHQVWTVRARGPLHALRF